MDRTSVFTMVSKGYGHSWFIRNVLISDPSFHLLSLLFGKGTSDLLGLPLLWKRVCHLQFSLTVALLLSSFLPGADRLALDQHPVSKFNVDFCTRQKISDAKLKFYRNLVLGIHGRYYLDVGLPGLIWLVMFGLTRYLFFIRPDQIAAKPWYVIYPVPNLISPFGNQPRTSLTSIFQYLGYRHESIPKSFRSNAWWGVLIRD